MTLLSLSWCAACTSEDKTEPPTLEQRLDALVAADQIELWVGDFNGTGTEELALVAVTSSVATASRGLSSPQITAQIGASGVSSSLATNAVVLTLDEGPGLRAIQSNAGLSFESFQRSGVLAVGSRILNIVQRLRAIILTPLSDAQCDILIEVTELLGEAVKLGIVGIIDFVDWLYRQLVAETIELPTMDNYIDDTSLIECLNTEQTVLGCFFIQLGEVVFDRDSHCYQVPQFEGSNTSCMTCSDDPLEFSELCDKATDTTGCCHRNFVFDQILRSDLRNMAPMPQLRGPINEEPTEILLDGIPANIDELILGLSFGINSSLVTCVAQGLLASNNPIELSIDAPGRCGATGACCAQNLALPSHILQGRVRQCLVEDDRGVYSNICGFGSNARFKDLNEYLGPRILGRVRDRFRTDVTNVLQRIDRDGYCCDENGTLQGATVVFMEEGGIEFEPDSSSSCTPASDAGVGRSDAGSGDDDAGRPGGDGGVGGLDAGVGGLDAGVGAVDSGSNSGADGGSVVTPDAGVTSLGPRGVSTGDPHLQTFDGVAYDMQGVGELILVRSSSTTRQLEIQVRTAPWGTRTDVTINSAVAARIDGDRVALYRDNATLRINGETRVLPAGITTLDGGGQVIRSGNTYTLVWMDGSRSTWTANAQLINVEVALNTDRAGATDGLLGNSDGRIADELRNRRGEPLSDNPSFFAFYTDYVESWRIEQAESLFDYEPGEDTDTFTDRAFPAVTATTSGVSGAARAAAEQTCRDAGILDPIWLQACILDVALTGETSFAEGFVDLPEPMVAQGVGPSIPRCSGGDDHRPGWAVLHGMQRRHRYQLPRRRTPRPYHRCLHLLHRCARSDGGGVF